MGSTGLGNIPKKKQYFLTPSLTQKCPHTLPFTELRQHVQFYFHFGEHFKCYPPPSSSMKYNHALEFPLIIIPMILDGLLSTVLSCFIVEVALQKDFASQQLSRPAFTKKCRLSKKPQPGSADRKGLSS